MPETSPSPATPADPRSGRGRRALVAAIGMLAAAAVVTAGAVVSEGLARERAVEEHAAAAASARDAGRGLAEADAARLEVATGLATLLADAEEILGETGKELVDRTAREGLEEQAERVREYLADELEGLPGDSAEGDSADADSAAAADPAADGDLASDDAPQAAPGAALAPDLTRQEIGLLADGLLARAEADRAESAGLAARAARIATARDGLDAGLGSYLAAVAARGEKLAEDRDDAGDDELEALAARVEALREADAAGAREAFAAYRKAAKEVVDSSEEARAAARAAASFGGGGGGSYTVPPETIVDDPASITVVVNKRRALPTGYVPAGLVIPSGIPNNNGQPVRSELVGPLKQMSADMRSEIGRTLRIASAYRGFATQKSIYTRYVRSYGQSYADSRSARPGHSEHQTGLAVDLDDGTGCVLNQCFGDTKSGRWLRAHAHEYGFILRYDKGMQSRVGYAYEPWHFRYVGVGVATDMKNRGVATLEEYYGLPDAPDYG